ncbi:MATE family efflux transporter [Brackiella oedipodis]|uniref:MATE family efflux transporter n=1 Tax=Brackiella oedipodis TaxID=124225 RepID=UPI00048EAB99|nr:MATE family efflux transporter [Brackiella oedipodis]
MASSHHAPAPSQWQLYKQLIWLAIPIILANATVPLLGLADTAVIGHNGTPQDLAAIALAALIFNFVYWSFGFLRMATTGFVAQAKGARQRDELLAVIYRALLLAALIGLVLLLLQTPIVYIAMQFLSASDTVNDKMLDYFYVRIWDAPASLMIYVVLGSLIGLSQSRSIMWFQILLNALNIILNVSLVWGLQMGVKGIALGTVLAQYFMLLCGLVVLFRHLGVSAPWLHLRQLWSRVCQRDKLLQMFHVNRDIMIRTLALTAGFAWFARQGAQLGDDVLAANHILLQFVALAAFFLDGFANVAEMRVGHAFGAGDAPRFKQEVKASAILSLIAAAILALGIYLGSEQIIQWLTEDSDLQRLAHTYAWLACLYIFFSFGAFLLDGVFIGVTYSKAMRNSTVIAFVSLILLSLWWLDDFGNTGLWAALIAYVIMRAIVLIFYLPKLQQQISTKSKAPNQ